MKPSVTPTSKAAFFGLLAGLLSALFSAAFAQTQNQGNIHDYNYYIQHHADGQRLLEAKAQASVQPIKGATRTVVNESLPLQARTLAAPAASGQHWFLRQRMAFLIYTTYIHPDGSLLRQMNQAEITRHVNAIKEFQQLVWRNSGFKYMLDGDIHIITRPISANNMNYYGSWGYLYFDGEYNGNSVANDLYGLGYANGGLDGVVVCYAWKDTDEFTTGYGGGTLGLDLMGGFMGGCGLTSIPVTEGKILGGYLTHEYLHQVEGVFIASGMRDNVIWCHFQDNTKNPPIPFYPDIANLQVFRSYYLQGLYPALKRGVSETCTDADNDGVPANVGPFFLSEAVLGTNDANPDSDGDGVSDLNEMLAFYHTTQNPLSIDTDGDNQPDASDPLAIDKLDPFTAVPAAPMVDGLLGNGEHRWNKQITSANNADFSANISIETVGNRLFISADVVDDIVTVNNIYWSDGFYLYFDFNGDGYEFFPGNDDFYLKVAVNSSSQGSPMNANYFVKRIVNSGGKSWTEQDISVTMNAKYQVVANGYHLELEVPISSFGVSLSSKLNMAAIFTDTENDGSWTYAPYHLIDGMPDWTGVPFVSMINSSPANVAILGSWTQGFSHTKEPGKDRALVAMVYGEGSSNISASSVTYGGKVMTKVNEKSYSNGTYSYTGAFILKEEDIASASSGAIAVNWNPGSAPTTGSDVASVFLTGVNQTTPIGATATGAIVGATVTTTALANSSGDMVLAAGTAANNGTYSINNGFTRGIPETSASFGDITSACKPATGADETPSLKSSSSQRQTIVGFVVKRSAAAPVQYTITASAGSNGSISPSGGVLLNSGTNQTFTITPDNCCQVEAVVVDGVNQGAITSYTFSNVTANRTIYATFKIRQYSLAANATNGTITLNPPGGTYACGTVVTVTATPNSGYTFTGWSGDLSGSTNSTTITMNSDKTVTANFTAPVSNLVKNGDFSNGMTNWVFTSTSPSTAIGGAISGQFFVDITNDDGTNWHLQLKQSGISLQNGKSCTITFDAKAQSSRGIVVQVKDGSGTSRCWATPAISTAMQKYTVTFTNAGATGSNYQLLFFLGAAGANDVWLDNVLLKTN